jgi:type III restriction enzyme
VAALDNKRVAYRLFTEDEQREIVFRDMNTDEQSHVTAMDTAFTPNYQNMIGFFARSIMRDLRLVGGFDVLFGKLKEFVESYLFERTVDLDDLNTLRNLSEIEATRTLVETIKGAVNALTVQDTGTTEVRGSIRLAKTRPFLVKEQPFLVPKKSIFNKVVGDSHFELEFAAFLDGCPDIVSFVKNSQSTSFRIEYQNADGSIANYIPDFIVKQTDSHVWIVETKGREDLDDPLKWDRLQQWCADATAHDEAGRTFSPLFVRQEDWEQYKPTLFHDVIAAHR